MRKNPSPVQVAVDRTHFLQVVGWAARASPTWQLLHQSQQRRESSSKMEVVESGSLIPKAPSQHFCCVLQTRSKSLGQRIHNWKDHPRAWMPEDGDHLGAIVELSCHNEVAVSHRSRSCSKSHFLLEGFSNPSKFNSNSPLTNRETWRCTRYLMEISLIVLGRIMLFWCCKKMFFLRKTAEVFGDRLP